METARRTLFFSDRRFVFVMMNDSLQTTPRFFLLKTIGDYIALTKPRVMTLLIFTAVSGAFLAARGSPSWEILTAVIFGGAFASGGAATLNMLIERDLDKRMGRTKGRPIAEGRIGRIHALAFGVALNALAFVIFFLLSNWLAAVLAMAGTALYVFLYTVLLKRMTVNNIVVGGVAGSVPPLVGYAAVSGTLTLEAWWLAAIIFFWTPPHFWALALMIKRDYARANIPMLPVIRGESETRLQILLYSMLLVALSVGFGAYQAGLFFAPLGIFYLTGSAILGIGFMWFAFKLWREKTRDSAWTLYKFSLIYTFLLFAVIMADASVESF